MKFVADLHIHSHYSRATSKNLDFEHLSQWAQLKGVNVVGTGDIAHPGWLQEMRDKLEPAEAGLFKLKDELAQAVQAKVPAACQAPVRFMLAGEISSIYKKGDKVRKIHNVIFAPSLETVEKIQAALEKIGNIRSDGRPILGLDSRDLLEIILDIDPHNYLIPAHIWTPWFSLLGSKSGFDSVEECFEDLTPHIFAVETGLSSDPPMNWRISFLDRYTLVSNSDAHSPQKLAREANLFDTELSYPAIFAALHSGDPAQFLGTIEFFPEEGKYHYDGHRKCELRWDPQTTLTHQGRCPVCGKKVTVGVMHRVESLADRPENPPPARPQGFDSLIPLPEILSEVHDVGPQSKRVQRSYHALLAELGSELAILQDIPPEALEQAGGALLAEGVRRVRAGEVHLAPGYDGEFGTITLFEPHERQQFKPQLQMFETQAPKQKPASPPPASPPSSLVGDDESPTKETGSPASPPAPAEPEGHQTTLFQPAASPAAWLLAELNPAQQAAVQTAESSLLIVAGPGTGKTRTLTYRLAYLITQHGVDPAAMLAITFTNKAAEEMATRLNQLLDPAQVEPIVIKTFHAFGALLLQEVGQPEPFAICSQVEREALLRRIAPSLSAAERRATLEQISRAKNHLLGPDDDLTASDLELDPTLYRRYEAALAESHLLDFDDLILRPVRLLERQPALRERYQARFRWISVDEYQDINLAQYRLLRLLTGPETNLCAIGDPDQAIYGFRGADRRYFLSFAADFPAAQTLQLSQNYRSTQLILDASRQVITQSPESEPLELRSELLDPTRLKIYAAPTDKAEAEFIVHEIEKRVGGTSYFSLDSGRVEDEGPAQRTFADFAVLYRLSAQSRLLHEALDRSGIPYQTVGQRSLYEQKPVRHLLAYLWLALNPHSRLHLATILGAGSAVEGEPLAERLVEAAETAGVAVGTLGQNLAELDFLSGPERRRLGQIAPRLAEIEAGAGQTPVAELIERLAEQLAPEAQPAWLAPLRLRAVPFAARLADFLEATALQKETDGYDPRADRVTLLTLHAAKGLEFPVVFIVGCEEGLLPYQRGQTAPDREEERRLFYVGMTRAQQRLILTRAQRRFLFGQEMNNPPSPFLADIEQALKEIEQPSPRQPAPDAPDHVQLKLF